MKCLLLIILALALSRVTHANSRYITAEHWKQLLEQESKNIVITGTIVKSKNLGFYKNFQYIAPDEVTYKKLYPDDINAIYLEAITIKVDENVDPSARFPKPGALLTFTQFESKGISENIKSVFGSLCPHVSYAARAGEKRLWILSIKNNSLVSEFDTGLTRLATLEMLKRTELRSAPQDKTSIKDNPDDIFGPSYKIEEFEDKGNTSYFAISPDKTSFELHLKKSAKPQTVLSQTLVKTKTAKLTALSISQDPLIDSPWLKKLKSRPHVTELWLHHFLKKGFNANLPQFPNVEHLYLYESGIISTLPHFKKCHTLKTDGLLEKAAFDQISKWPSLKTIECSASKQVSPTAIKQLLTNQKDLFCAIEICGKLIDEQREAYKKVQAQFYNRCIIKCTSTDFPTNKALLSGKGYRSRTPWPSSTL